jgi:hypothetical protein
MDYHEWKRKFDASHLLAVLAGLSDQVPDEDPKRFKTCGVGLTTGEYRVMAALISWRLNPQTRQMDSGSIRRITRMDRGNLSRVLRALGTANLVINLAGNSAPNFAPNPDLSYWDLQYLKRLRGVRNGKNKPPWRG